MRFCLYLFTLCCSSLFAKPQLSDFKKNVYSQWGEDGIIEKIFSIIGTTSKIAVEFGAADGFAYANTAHLWTSDRSWTAYLIESDLPSYQNLVQNVANYPCIPVFRTVGISPNDSLEVILSQIGLNSTIDILSIDIDGNDYYIFDSLIKLRPRLILCEYNPTIPAHLDIYASYNNYMGCSVAAIQRVAKNKGYSLVAITETNCFFVRDEDFPLFADYETERDKICINQFIRYLITDYAGNYSIVAKKDFLEPYGINHYSTQQINGEFIKFPPIK